MSNGKVLTVSYGTFSCTLEGFDDSLETMKKVAEYFRDLSAGDRLFGSVTELPGTDELVAMAKTHEQPDVTAQVNDTQIKLSANSAVTEDETQSAMGTTLPGASVTQRLQLLRSVASQQTETFENEANIFDTEFEEDEHAESDELQATISDIETAFQADAVQDSLFATVRSAGADEILEEAREDLENAASEDADSVYADREGLEEVDQEVAEVQPVDLAQEIRSEAAEAEAELDDAAFEPFEFEATENLDETLSESAVPDEDIDAHIDEMDQDGTEADVSDLVSSLLETESAPAPSGEADGNDDGGANGGADIVEDAVEQAPEPLSGSDSIRKPRIRILKVKRTEVERAYEEGRIEDAEPENDLPFAGMSSLSAAEEEDLAAELAKVHDEPQAEPEEEALEDTTDVALGDAEPDTLAADEGAADATDDSVPADVETSVAEAPDDALVEQVEDIAAEGGQGQNELVSEAAPEQFETDVDRLMDKADEEMDEPETTKRRNAFQALKAAVAARRADIGLSGGRDRAEEEMSEEYRSDLAQVVQPKQAADTSKEKQAKPAGQRPAPLRLVAEQRVDVEEEQSSQDAVASDESGQNDEEKNFADFVEKSGAHELPDLLEAAASYLALVEGKKQFSRPQLMSKVRLIAGDDYSREEGLRSFGQLLRSGKLEKIRGGRFTVTPETGYRPASRATG